MITRIASIALVVASLLIIPVPAVGAEGDVNEFFEFYDQGDLVTQDKYGFALLNLYDGLSQANVALRFRGDAHLYCPPGNLALTESQLVDILRRYRAEHPEEAGFSLGLILLEAIIDVFPCSEDTN